MIVLWIILWIVVAATLIGIAAVIADMGKKSAHKPYGPYERFVKRGLDAFLSTGALIVFSPVLLVTAVLVRVKLGRLYCSNRIDQGGMERYLNSISSGQ